MPELSSRSQHEKAIIGALLLQFEDIRARRQPWPTVEANLAGALRPLLVDVFGDAAENLAASRNAEIDQKRLDDRAGTYGEKQAAVIAKLIVDNTVETVAGGESTDNVLGISRAEQIAASETTRAITAGEAVIVAILLATMDIELVPIWHTEADGRVCPICKPLHGKGEAVYRRVAPGPPAHPNCRCWLDYEVKA